MDRRLKWKFFFEHPSVRDLVEFISLPVSRRNLAGWAYFPLFFFLTIVLPLKAKRGGSPYIFTSMKFL